MEREYHKGSELTMANLGLSLEGINDDQPLELLAREGARLVLSVALEEEVADFLRCQRYERNQGCRHGYRNSHRERQVSCGAGEVEVAMPRVSDNKEAFHSQLFEAWQRHSRLLEEMIPLLYIEGLSTRAFKRALSPLWGKSGLSRSSISRANKALKEAFNNWRRRNLSLKKIVYLTDGNQGLLKAIDDIWPEVPWQRCAVHRIRNVLARVPKKRQDEVGEALHRIFYAAWS